MLNKAIIDIKNPSLICPLFDEMCVYISMPMYYIYIYTFLDFLLFHLFLIYFFGV